MTGDAHHGRSADDKEPPKVPITLFGDATKPFLAARAVRSRCQTEPGRELAA